MPARANAAGCVRGTPTRDDPDLALMVERHHAEWFLAEGLIAGAEVHADPDVTWLLHPGEAWRNGAIMVRFSESAAARRLDTLIGRYQRHGRGMAMWISPAATPRDLSALLTHKGLRCRKHFPAMIRVLASAAIRQPSIPGLDIRRVGSIDEFTRTPHPAIGPITTPLRETALERLGAIAMGRQPQTTAFVAWLDDEPVGASELFLGAECAGVHSLSVPPEHQGKGIGSALLEQCCAHAGRSGASQIVLLASSDGQRLYERSDFRAVARFAYWYRSFQRCR